MGQRKSNSIIGKDVSVLSLRCNRLEILLSDSFGDGEDDNSLTEKEKRGRERERKRECVSESESESERVYVYVCTYVTCVRECMRTDFNKSEPYKYYLFFIYGILLLY